MALPAPPANVVTYIGIFIIVEAIFSIIYYFEGPGLPHVFRAIRAVFGAYLVWSGTTYSLDLYSGLFSQQVAFFVMMALSILAGYEVAVVLQSREEEDEEGEQNQ